jgi:hypothetical protein
MITENIFITLMYKNMSSSQTNRRKPLKNTPSLMQKAAFLLQSPFDRACKKQMILLEYKYDEALNVGNYAKANE